MPSGTFPENWFLPKLMAPRLFEPPIPFGISPSKELSDKSGDLSPFKDQIPDGKDPKNWFDEKLIDARVEHELKLSGIFSESLFLANEMARRDPHCLKKSSDIALIPRRRRRHHPWRCRCHLTDLIVGIIRTFSNLKPMNPNKTIKRIKKIEKEICGVYDFVLIFYCSGYGLCSKFMGLIFG